MKNVKSWLTAVVFSLIITILSVGGGYALFLGIDNVQTVITQIEEIAVKPSYAYLKSVTVRIYQTADEGTFVGTGSIIKITKNYTYILTNKHVAPIENPERIIVEDEDGKLIKAEVLKNCFFADLSLIRVKGEIKHKQAIKGIGKISHSDKAYSVGMYLGNHYIYTEGTVAGYDSDDNFIINIPGAGGCSGSGVFNNKGELVAVVFAGNYINYPYQVETAKLLCINTWEIEMFLFQTKELIK